MTIKIFSTPDRAARAAASLVAARVRRTPESVLGLPTGRSVRAVYDELARLHKAGRVSFRRARTINLDEFVGLAPSHPGSFAAFMQDHFFSRVDIAPARAHLLNGRAPAAAECRRYERLIARLGRIDLQLLGVGENGHIGFNEPADALVARTHRARLTLTTRRANAGRFGNRVADVPRDALTVGMATILEARTIVLVATGRSKRRALRALFSGCLS